MLFISDPASYAAQLDNSELMHMVLVVVSLSYFFCFFFFKSLLYGLYSVLVLLTSVQMFQ